MCKNYFASKCRLFIKLRQNVITYYNGKSEDGGSFFVLRFSDFFFSKTHEKKREREKEKNIPILCLNEKAKKRGE